MLDDKQLIPIYLKAHDNVDLVTTPHKRSILGCKNDRMDINRLADVDNTEFITAKPDDLSSKLVDVNKGQRHKSNADDDVIEVIATEAENEIRNAKHVEMNEEGQHGAQGNNSLMVLSTRHFSNYLFYPL